MAAVTADPRMKSGVSRRALGEERRRTLTAQQALQVGKPRQHQEIEQHINEHRNESDCEHCNLGDTEPPEDAFVAERPEPQQFRQPIEKLEKESEKNHP